MTSYMHQDDNSLKDGLSDSDSENSFATAENDSEVAGLSRSQSHTDELLLESMNKLPVMIPTDKIFAACPEDDSVKKTYNIEKNMETALSFKQQGNVCYRYLHQNSLKNIPPFPLIEYANLFREKSFDDAIECYSRAIENCPDDSEEGREQLSIFYGNRAACYFAVHEYEVSVEDCSTSLSLCPNYVKVLFRRSQALEHLDKLDDALSGIKTGNFLLF